MTYGQGDFLILAISVVLLEHICEILSSLINDKNFKALLLHALSDSRHFIFRTNG